MRMALLNCRVYSSFPILALYINISMLFKQRFNNAAMTTFDGMYEGCVAGAILNVDVSASGDQSRAYFLQER